MHAVRLFHNFMWLWYLLRYFLWFVCQYFSRLFRIVATESWWCHQAETFSALLAFCEGNALLVTGVFPTQKARDSELWFFFISAWTNGAKIDTTVISDAIALIMTSLQWRSVDSTEHIFLQTKTSVRYNNVAIRSSYICFMIPFGFYLSIHMITMIT